MIRINLLTAAKRSTRGATGGGGTTSWYAGYAAAALILMVVLALVYNSKNRELEDQLAVNHALEEDIDRVQRQSANIDEVRAQLERSQQLEAVVAELQRARFGPTRILMELSRVLSTGGQPTIDPQRYSELTRTNPHARFNPSWDSHRLWVIELREEEREVTIRGIGKTNEDVAEFLRRLTLSDYFTAVHLERTESMRDAELHLDLIAFELTCRAEY